MPKGVGRQGAVVSVGVAALWAIGALWAVSVIGAFGLFMDTEWQNRRETRRLEKMWAMPTVDPHA